MKRGKFILYTYYVVLFAVVAGYGYAATSMIRDHATVSPKSMEALLSSRR